HPDDHPRAASCAKGRSRAARTVSGPAAREALSGQDCTGARAAGTRGLHGICPRRSSRSRGRGPVRVRPIFRRRPGQSRPAFPARLVDLGHATLALTPGKLMSYNILLYGATGYSGRLIAAELKRWNDATGDYRVVLAARDGERLKQVASRFGMDHKVFGLDEKRRVQAGLRGMDVVLNTAGPFALTARRLATVAISVGCSYVDINGEADVYTRLKRSLE